MNNFNYTKVGSVAEAVTLVTQNSRAEFVAGGTNIIDRWKYNLTNFDSLADLGNLGQLRPVHEKDDGGLRIDAFSTNSATAYDKLIEDRYPLLSKAILAGASAQIRNMATNGGNLLQRTRCFYFYDSAMPCNKRLPGSGCPAVSGYNRIHAILGTSEQCIAVFPSDMCVALSALGAIVNVSGPVGERNIPFFDFHRLPGETPHIDNNLLHGEVITSIDLPSNGFSKNYSYLKLRDRNSYAFALVSVATGLELEGTVIKDARIALGGVSHKPWRSTEAEDFLKGKEATAASFAAAADIILRGAVTYEYNSFKLPLAKKAIVRNCMMALDPATQLPGAQPSA